MAFKEHSVNTTSTYAGTKSKTTNSAREIKGFSGALWLICVELIALTWLSRINAKNAVHIHKKICAELS